MPDDRFLHSRAGHSVKVSGLSDFEYRVWTQYLLSADDFGVMRASAVTMQSDSDALAERPARAIEKAVKRLVTVGLLAEFEHQGRFYLYQPDWQKWQKVGYPRKTKQPRPEGAQLDACDFGTQRLFGIHPGGDGKKFTKGPEKDSEKVSGKSSEDISTTRAGASREVANAERLPADGERQTADAAPPLDTWFVELQEAYPRHRVSGGYMAQSAFCDQFARDPRPARVVWAEMQANLENQKTGHEWRERKMVPTLEKWLREVRWKQVHETEAPPAPRNGGVDARLIVRQDETSVEDCPHVARCTSRLACQRMRTQPDVYPLREGVPA